jgi:Spy/CpxP family protein refolding chaperone
MVNKYLMMLLSVGILGVGMTAMGQEKDAPPAPPEAREGRPGGPGGPGGRGMMAMSKELREATQKLRQTIREYDKDKNEQKLEEIKKQVTAIQDIQIKELETQLTEMKAKKEENINKTIEQIKSGEFQKQLNRFRQGGERGGRKPGEGGPQKF